MKWRWNKGIGYFLLFCLSLLMLVVDHRGMYFGDFVFKSIGIPPWSKSPGEGIHYPIVFGVLLLVVSGKLFMDYCRGRYPKIGRRAVLSCVILIFAFPTLSYWSTLALNVNRSGLPTLDYSAKDSQCNFNTGKEEVNIRCELQLMNYGSSPMQVGVKPLLQDEFHKYIGLSKLKIEHQEVLLPPRSSHRYTLNYTAQPLQLLFGKRNSSGSTAAGGVHFVQGDEERIVIWE
ncbi:hypothetical protein [Paenibacillus turpanensis]|uniref:hypothetical protein n=1 Tax=Paenibacillus turpanensis TaxID=2689078 RepID=UPI00140C7D2D|nr:hypothetical protein [Paenibacillus turpanensis]